MIDPEKDTSKEKGKSRTDLSAYSAQRNKLVTMVAHFAVVLFTVFICYTAVPGSSLFSWHPTMMTIGFVLFMTEAILMFSQQSSMVRGDRKLQVRSHWIFQLCMIVSICIGFSVIYINKVNHDAPHFTSWHGLIGLITVISCGLQAIAGVTLLYPSLLCKLVTLGQAKIYHATYGLVNYTLVVISLNFALWTGWAAKNITGASWFGCIACIDILGLVVMNQITNNWLPRIRAQNSRS